MPVIGSSPLLGPLVGLVSWTFVMEAWMYAGRIPALNSGKVNVNPNMTREQMNAGIPRSVQWKADNYNHLFEQPTQFYAIMFALITLDAKDPLTVNLAWGYVGLRVVHSLIQAIANPIMVRFSVFALSSFTLLGLTARTAMMMW